jgi:hypothetical protein
MVLFAMVFPLPQISTPKAPADGDELLVSVMPLMVLPVAPGVDVHAVHVDDCRYCQPSPVSHH